MFSILVNSIHILKQLNSIKIIVINGRVKNGSDYIDHQNYSMHLNHGYHVKFHLVFSLTNFCFGCGLNLSECKSK
jgi:hypothetical protein